MRICLTGGRAPACLDLARALRAAGHDVFIAESQGAHLSRTSRAIVRSFRVPAPRHHAPEFIAGLVDIVRAQRIDVLIPTCEEVFYVARGRDQFPESCRVWVDDPRKLAALHDKWLFNQAADGIFVTPQSYLLSSPDQWRALENLDGEWILKPTFSRFGISIHRGEIKALRRLNLNIGPGRTWVLQKFIPGHEVCAYAVADEGRLKALSIYAHAFTAGYAGVSFEEVAAPLIAAQIERFAQAQNFSGQLAFDFMVDAAGVAHVLECNPRATSGLHLLTPRADFPNVFCAPAAVNEVIRAPVGSGAMLGLPVLLLGPTQVRSWPKLREWIRVLRRAREVIFSWRDPWPGFDQILCSLGLVARGLRLRGGPLAASTADIEWNGDA